MAGKKGGKPTDYRKTKNYADLKHALLDSLIVRGLDGQMYTDKVEEYMDFWVRRQQLRDDVAQRGLTVTDERGRITENRSVSLEIQVARQMLAVFAALGYKAEDFKGLTKDDDDL